MRPAPTSPGLPSAREDIHVCPTLPGCAALGISDPVRQTSRSSADRTGQGWSASSVSSVSAGAASALASTGSSPGATGLPVYHTGRLLKHLLGRNLAAPRTTSSPRDHQSPLPPSASLKAWARVFLEESGAKLREPVRWSSGTVTTAIRSGIGNATSACCAAEALTCRSPARVRPTTGRARAQRSRRPIRSAWCAARDVRAIGRCRPRPARWRTIRGPRVGASTSRNYAAPPKCPGSKVVRRALDVQRGEHDAQRTGGT